MTALRPRIDDLVAEVVPVDDDAADAARARWDALAKPPGSLGVIEDVGVRLAAIAGTCPPPVPARPSLLVCAADHGVHAQGVTPWPQAITTAMVEVMADGRASCNAIARSVGAAVTVLDVGCATPPDRMVGLRSARVRAGTADLSVGPAMTDEEAARAVLAGASTAEEMIVSGTDLLVLGDMGLANTTASAALVVGLTGADPTGAVGPGAGADEATVRRKQEIVARATARLAGDVPADRDPLAVLAEVGGLEHAALVGAALAGAAARIPVLLDGVITDAAALVAVRLAPAAAGYLLAGHRSTEPGASIAMDAIGHHPLLDLRLRLGEGTGGLLAVPLVRAAAAALAETAAIADLG